VISKEKKKIPDGTWKQKDYHQLGLIREFGGKRWANGKDITFHFLHSFF